MFQPGDFVVYGSSGVCRVIQVGALEGKSADPTRQYYTLQPVFESERIYTPVDSGVFIRPAMTKEQAQAFIRQIPSIGEDLCTERNPATLRIHYEASLQSHQCEELVRLIKGIRHKCRETEKKGRKMGQVDQRYRKKAEGLLHGELAIALGHPPGPGGAVYPREYGGGWLSASLFCCGEFPPSRFALLGRGDGFWTYRCHFTCPAPCPYFFLSPSTCHRCAPSSGIPAPAPGPALAAGGAPRPGPFRTAPGSAGTALHR